MVRNSFRTGAAIWAVGSALAFAVSAAVAPSAYADDLGKGAIATGPNGHWAMAWGQPNESEAQRLAKDNCGSACNVVLTFASCGALVRKGNDFYTAEGPTRSEAESNARRQSAGGTYVLSACNEGVRRVGDNRG